ncbi:MAG: hypothetical protein AAB358_03330 [Patescibacteria group bacterium]
MNFINYRKCLFFLICFVSVFFFSIFSVSAATISPPIIEVEVDPGQSVTKTIKVFNETDSDIAVKGYLELFKPKGERGEVEILPPEIGGQVLSWVKLPLNSVSLEPSEIVEAPVIITIPKNIPVGGYYVAAMWESSAFPADQTKQVKINSRVGVLLLIRVKGEAKEELSILNFQAVGASPFWGENFYRRLPVNFYARLENTGNVHLKPTGLVIIKNIFGRVAASIPFNSDGRYILPQSKKQFDSVWSKGGNSGSGFWPGLKAEITGLSLGRYTAQVQVDYGAKKERLYSGEASFWVVPWRTILMAGIILFIVVIFRKIFRSRK